MAKDSPLRRYDWILLVAVIALSLIGTLLVYSATQPSADPRSYLIKQLINVALGVILMVVVSLLDYRQIRLLAPFVYVASVLGLAAVLSPLGTSVSGAKAWINLPAGFQVEPSEFAKIGLVLIIAVVFGELRDSGRIPGPRHAAGVLAAGADPGRAGGTRAGPRRDHPAAAHHGRHDRAVRPASCAGWRAWP